MTESEWHDATDPEPMLRFLGKQVPEAVLRLFAAACCRRIWHLLPDKRSRRCVEVAERYARDRASEEELSEAQGLAEEVYQDANLDASDPVNPDPRKAVVKEAAAQAAWIMGDPSPGFVGSVWDVARCCAEAMGGGQLPNPSESAAQANLLREFISYPPASRE
jgi:hypothetical protein